MRMLTCAERRMLTSGLTYLKKQIYKLFFEIYAFLLLKILNLLYY
jgi:hypothetical protein